MREIFNHKPPSPLPLEDTPLQTVMTSLGRKAQSLVQQAAPSLLQDLSSLKARAGEVLEEAHQVYEDLPAPLKETAEAIIVQVKNDPHLRAARLGMEVLEDTIEYVGAQTRRFLRDDCGLDPTLAQDAGEIVKQGVPLIGLTSSTLKGSTSLAKKGVSWAQKRVQHTEGKAAAVSGPRRLNPHTLHPEVSLEASVPLEAPSLSVSERAALFEQTQGKKAVQNMSTEDFVQSLANRAERKFEGKGPEVGKLKHKYAKAVGSRYQKMTGDKSELMFEQRFIRNKKWKKGDGLKGSVVPDIYDSASHKVLDYKFGNAHLSKNQIRRTVAAMPKFDEAGLISRTNDGIPIIMQEVKPTS